MSQSNLKLVTSDPPRSPERVALAEAIVRHAKAERALAAITAASERAWEVTSAARAKVKRAEKSVEAAKEAATEDVTAALLKGEGRRQPRSTRSSRLALVEAEDALAIAEAAKAALPEKRSAAELAVSTARSTLRDRVRDVVRSEPAVERVIAEYAAARRRFEDLAAVMHHLHRREMLPPEAGIWNQYVVFDASLPPGSPWEAAIAALAESADATLPE